MTQRAVVVFLGRDLVDNAAWWSRFLKPGFLHCFLLIEAGNRWVKIEGSYGRLRITQPALDEDEHEHYMRYVDRGAVILKTDVLPEFLVSPFMPRTCVGLIKAALGIRSWALTPWQLYKHMRKHT